MKDKYVDLRIVSRCSEEEIKEFLRLCMKIQYLGCVGTHRHIDVDVDGDGSGSLMFYVLEEDGKEKLLPTPRFKDADERDKYLDNMKQSIGG